MDAEIVYETALFKALCPSGVITAPWKYDDAKPASPTFAVGGVSTDGGEAALALADCFGVQVYASRVFPTIDSLCTEVMAWRTG